MKRTLLILLACLAPLWFAAGPYLEGFGMLPRQSGFMLSAGFFFVGTPILSLLIALRCFKSSPRRIATFFVVQILQVALVFGILPPGAKIETIGIGHRLKRNLPVQTLKDCSNLIAQRFLDGTLVTNSPPVEPYSALVQVSSIVAESELPEALRGKFRYVLVTKNRGSTEVFFVSEREIGIVCSKKHLEKDYSHYRIADGVYAYHYDRL